MSLHDRAAQFAPFSALTGYDAAVRESARITDRRMELDEESIRILNERLNMISNHISEKPIVSITYFVPDQYKEGGKYVTVCEAARRIDFVNQILILTNGNKITITDIAEICLQKNR